MNFEPAYNRLNLAQVPPRIGSFTVDFCACVFTGKLIESLVGINDDNWLGLIVFSLIWLGDRVLIAGNNQGQSLGRWLVSLKAVDMNYGKSAGSIDLFKRELIIFPFLALLLIASKYPTSAVLFAGIPLVVDAVFALADSRKIQTLHDKFGGTIVVVTRRGFQLDRKIAKVFNQLSRLSGQALDNREQTRNRGKNRYQDQEDMEYYNSPAREPPRTTKSNSSKRPRPRR